MKIIALVPMKGNSERVPNKNLKIFNGRPLYHLIVNSLLKSKYIDEVIINTDSDKISENVRENFTNVRVIKRPKELHGDFVSMNKIIDYDLSNSDGEIYLQTHSTNPLLKTETIDNALEAFIKNRGTFDSVFSVTKLQTRLYDKNGVAFNHNPDELIRTQDLDPLYEENSNFFIFTKESFKKVNARIGISPKMFPMDKIEAIDIDEPQDFIIAEALERVL